MKIQKVAITYGELRSKGFPLFSNERYELTLEALLEPGETAEGVRAILTDTARSKVRIHFGDPIIENQMDIPF